MKYAVVIVTYNRLKLLKECLQCVDSQTHKFEKIIIVNNASTDGTGEFLKANYKDRKDVILVEETHNKGGAGGFKDGVNAVPSEIDYVLLIDDDAMIDKAFVSSIDSQMEDKYLAYSGTVYMDGNIDVTHRRRIASRTLMTKKDVPLEEYNGESFECDLATFCGLMVSNDVIKKIGLPKEEYFIWYDDTEYCCRINKYSKIKNVNSAFLNHKVKASAETGLSWKSYYGYRNQIDVGRNYSNHPYVYLLYRYTYHRVRALLFWFKARNGKNNYYENCFKLHRNVVRDSKNNVMGLNENYLPGSSLH